MKAAARSFVLVVASSAPWIASCLGSGDDSPRPIRMEGGTDASMADAANGDGTIGDASPVVDGQTGEAMSNDGPADSAPVITTTSTVAGVRVANWSPDAPPVDFCLAPHGSGAFRGPIVVAASGDAGALDFPKVSAYTYVPPGAYDVRIVPGVAGVDCSAGGLLLRDAVLGGDAGLAAGSTTTLALLGMTFPPGADSGVDSGVSLRFLPLKDDSVGPAPSVPLDGAAVTDRFAVRFVHAAPGLLKADLGGKPVDLTGSGLTSPSWSFKGIAFGNANPWVDGGTDPNGYKSVSAVPPTDTLTVSLSGDASAPDAWPPPPTVPVAGGSVLTIVLAGTPGMGAAVQVMECVDNAGTANAYSSCRTLSVSTCGNGIREAFEECDCGATAGTSTDPQCAAPAPGGALQQNIDDPTYVCSTTCHLH